MNSETEGSQRHDIEQWWITAVGDTALWARMRLLESGAVEVFDAKGETLRYNDEDAARMALLDAEFRAFDGLDEDDAEHMGLELDSIEPPEAESDEELVPLMTEKLLRGHDG